MKIFMLGGAYYLKKGSEENNTYEIKWQKCDDYPEVGAASVRPSRWVSLEREPAWL